MKVKIFEFENTGVVNFEDEVNEDEINDFIKDKKVIDIKYQSFVLYTKYSKAEDIYDGDIAGNIRDRILVLYED